MDGPEEGRDAYLRLQGELLSSTRDNCAKEYDDLFRTFLSLDTKAQTTATIAGVQLAAIVAFLQRGSLETLFSTHQVFSGILLAVAVAVLFSVVVGCMLAMRVRDLPEAYQASQEVEAVLNLCRLPPEELTTETIVNHLTEHLGAWRQAVQAMSAATVAKARRVGTCQRLLILGLLLSSVLFLLLVVARFG